MTGRSGNGRGPDDQRTGEDNILARLADRLRDGSIADMQALQDAKLELLRDGHIRSVPGNAEILRFIRETDPELAPKVIGLLRRKPTRTLSGVAVIAVMTSPERCPHGRCRFCPGGPERDEPTPQSYTGREPAAMRASQNDFDPFRQTAARIRQLEEIGHPTDKIDLIIMGGTMTCRPVEYQEWFVKGCLDAMNGRTSPDLATAQEANESAGHRCIGMTFETRPDRCGTAEIDIMLRSGATRVELGFQTAFDDILEASGRGHTVQDSIGSTRRLKDSGLKVCYHLMPGLPRSDPELDVRSAELVFQDERFRPDMIKIYPTLVVEGTELFRWWKEGLYDPYSSEEAAEVVSRIKSLAPEWVRIQRVQRDIPSPLVEAGVKKSNLRQLAAERLEAAGRTCRCIRCREIGHYRPRSDSRTDDEVVLTRRDYSASGGLESFISFETSDGRGLIGFVRLRMPSPGCALANGASALIRELKVFGQAVPIGERSQGRWQHSGFGSRLMDEAERRAFEEWGMRRILVNAGVGVREYYRKRGYSLRGSYMEATATTVKPR